VKVLIGKQGKTNRKFFAALILSVKNLHVLSAFYLILFGFWT